MTFLPFCPRRALAAATDTLPWLVNITITWSSLTSFTVILVANIAVTLWLRLANVDSKLVTGTPIVFKSDCGIALAGIFCKRPRSEKNKI